MKILILLIIPCVMLFSFTTAYSQDFEPMVEKAKEYYGAEKYDSAAVLFEVALPLIEKKYGANDTGFYSKQVAYAAKSFDKSQQYEKAEQYYLEQKTIYQYLKDTINKGYVESISDLGLLYKTLGDYNAALILFEEAKQIIIQIPGNNDSIYANALFNLGVLFTVLGKFDAALPLLTESSEIYKRVDGENSHTYALSLNELASNYHSQGQYQSALPLFKQSLSIYMQIVGKWDINFAITQNNLASLYKDMGYFDSALPLFTENSEIFKEVAGPESFEYAVTMNNIADLYEALDNYNAAAPLYEKSLLIIEKIFGDRHPYYATLLNNISIIYKLMGNYETALPICEKASEIFEETLGPNHPTYAKSLNSIGSLFSYMKNYENASLVYNKCILIYKESIGTRNVDYAAVLNNLATLYRKMDNYKEAIPISLEAVSLYKELLGDRHPYYAVATGNLANLYTMMGNYNLAESIYQSNLVLYEGSKMKESMSYAITLLNLAWMHFLQGNLYEAAPFYQEASHIINHNIRDNFTILSEFEKEKYLIKLKDNYEIYLSLLIMVAKTHPLYVESGFNYELSLKGIILNYTSNLQKSILEHGDTSLVAKYEKLRVVKRQITSQLQKPVSNRNMNLDSLKNTAGNIERDLTQLCKAFSNLQASFKITCEDVQNHLSEKEGVIEFTSFKYYNNKRMTDSIYYCAYIQNKTDSIPCMVFLCEEKQLRNALPASGAGFKEIDPFYKDQTLYNLIWKPLDSLLQGISTVYFAPSGLLNSVSMAAIPIRDGKVLSEKYNLVQLSSTRSLALPEEPAAITDAVIYGGIKYETDTTNWLSTAGKYKKDESEVLAFNESFRGITRGGWLYLPGTMKEAGLIAEKLAKKGIDTTTFTGVNALEESFYTISGNHSPSVIHISTHGFYYPDTVSDEYRKNIINSASSDIQFKYADDPLLRSGLLMAGGNVSWKGLPRPEGLEDGILTAREVSNMNLMNTELVVLSACQTGQGDVKGSEGVEGLQRGFKMAGVHYIIMSLWQVPDKETTEFMGYFYDNWPGKMDIREAFRETQLKMKHKYPNEPYKWAGFVLME
jgi:CHAT domain-containing protein/tetratricopeptide (TPR) repeat protein